MKESMQSDGVSTPSAESLRTHALAFLAGGLLLSHMPVLAVLAAGVCVASAPSLLRRLRLQNPIGLRLADEPETSTPRVDR